MVKSINGLTGYEQAVVRRFNKYGLNCGNLGSLEDGELYQVEVSFRKLPKTIDAEKVIINKALAEIEKTVGIRIKPNTPPQRRSCGNYLIYFSTESSA